MYTSPTYLNRLYRQDKRAEKQVYRKREACLFEKNINIFTRYKNNAK